MEYEYDRYDIMEQKAPKKVSSNFRVTFDFYTPRTHFMILGRQHGKWRDFSEIDEKNRTHIVQLALDATDALKLQKLATFSIHRGSWATDQNNFHCHITSAIGDYQRVYEELSSHPPMSNWWPNQKFVTNQWKVSKSKTDYMKNVKSYPFKGYHAEEIKEIEKIKESKAPKQNHAIEKFPIVFHKYERQIGIAKTISRNAEQVLEMVELLDELAKELELNVKTGKEGSHICVTLTGAGFPDFENKTNEPVMGYLQVSGAVFYNNCDPKLRDRWFEAYKHSEDNVYT